MPSPLRPVAGFFEDCIGLIGRAPDPMMAARLCTRACEAIRNEKWLIAGEAFGLAALRSGSF